MESEAVYVSSREASFSVLAQFLASRGGEGEVLLYGDGVCGLEAEYLAKQRVACSARVECSAMRVDRDRASEEWEEAPAGARRCPPALVAGSLSPCGPACKACLSFTLSFVPVPLPAPDSRAALRMAAFRSVLVCDSRNALAIAGPSALDPHVMFAPRVTFYVKRPGAAVPVCMVVQPLTMLPRRPGAEVSYVVWKEDVELVDACRRRLADGVVTDALW